MDFTANSPRVWGARTPHPQAPSDNHRPMLKCVKMAANPPLETMWKSENPGARNGTKMEEADRVPHLSSPPPHHHHRDEKAERGKRLWCNYETVQITVLL